MDAKGPSTFHWPVQSRLLQEAFLSWHLSYKSFSHVQGPTALCPLLTMGDFLPYEWVTNYLDTLE
jgi:hypothetical protein